MLQIWNPGIQIFYFAHTHLQDNIYKKDVSTYQAGLQKRVDLPNPQNAIFVRFVTNSFWNSRVNLTKSSDV